MRDLRIALQPKQILFRESVEKFPISGYGGAKGGGKSHGLRAIMLLRRFQYPNLLAEYLGAHFQNYKTIILIHYLDNSPN